MNQALYAHMNNKRKMKKKIKVMDNLVEEILRQSTMQAVTGLLMAAFTQVYSENREKKKSIKT
jgi:hypothetical protein